MAKFFISFCSSDRIWVRSFRERLSRAFPDVDIFMDERSISRGDDWWNAILDNLATCNIVLYVLTNEFFESKYCRAEFLEAQRLNLEMLPLLVRPRTTLPFEFSSRNYVNMTEWFGDTSLPEDIYPTLYRALHLPLPKNSDRRNATPHPDRVEPSEWDWPAVTPSGWGSGRPKPFPTNGQQPPPQMPSPTASPTTSSSAQPQAEEQERPIPTPQPKFMIQGYDSVQLGCIAIFGVEDFPTIRSLCEKLTSLSYYPTEPYYSRMGEPVPEPRNPYTNIKHHSYDQLQFTNAEKGIFDKTFIILHLATHTPQGDPAFVFVNVRGDRLPILLEKAASNDVFNVSDYATLIEVGVGEPSIEVANKLQNDYLFSDRHLNVRLFPPLSEVT